MYKSGYAMGKSSICIHTQRIIVSLIYHKYKVEVGENVTNKYYYFLIVVKMVNPFDICGEGWSIFGRKVAQ